MKRPMKRRIKNQHVKHLTPAKTAVLAFPAGLFALASVRMGIRGLSALLWGIAAVRRLVSTGVRRQRPRRWVVICRSYSRTLRRHSIFVLIQLQLWLSSARVMSHARRKTSSYQSVTFRFRARLVGSSLCNWMICRHKHSLLETPLLQ